MPNRIYDLYGHDLHKGRDVGIEIEMEGANITTTASGWDVHSDGSLRPNPEAIEWVLHRPYPHKEISGLLKALQKALKDNEAKLSPSDRCGVHVHLNCQSYTVAQVLCIICTYLILEDALVKWCGEDREGNLFTLRAKDAENFIQVLLTAAINGNFNHISTEYRYSSVNLASLLKFGSLEFRSLRTPKDFSVIDTWVNMLIRIRDFALGFKHPREIIEMVSAQGFVKFPSIVLGDMAELIQCKGIGVMVCEGVRRVQEIAYVDLLYKKKEKPQEESLRLEVEPFRVDWASMRNNLVPNPTRATGIYDAETRSTTAQTLSSAPEWWEAEVPTPPSPTPPPRRTRQVIIAERNVVARRFAVTDSAWERDTAGRRYWDLVAELERTPE